MKNKHQKGSHVCISENGELTAFSTNLSHDIDVDNGDTFSINYGLCDVIYNVVDNRYPLVAEEIKED